jgi:hypothetical protein
MSRSFWFRSLTAALAATVVCVPGWSQDTFTPVAGWDEQLFPSYIISTAKMKVEEPSEDESAEENEAVDEATADEATAEEAVEVLGDPTGQLGVELTASDAGQQVKVTISCDEIMQPSTLTVQLPESGTTYQLNPPVKYKFQKLAEFTQATPATVTFTVQVGTDDPVEQTATIVIRPVNDCPFMVRYGDDFIDTSYTFAAYVNEQHPHIDRLLREALDGGVVDSFTGYQSGDPGEVIRQVYAIWNCLVDRDVRYSSITATAGASEMVYSQHVRMIDESLNNAQANCVDGSVLMASALRKIGIEPFLVLVPGHCYIGFYVDEEQTALLAVETTMIGADLREAEEIPVLEIVDESITEDLRGEWSWPSFTSAIVHATQDIQEHAEKFEDPNEPNYVLIDIAEARKMGILPIAYRGRPASTPVSDEEGGGQ